jgi:hypothetical protein
MTRKHHGMVPDLESDPFGERIPSEARGPMHLLGGRFRFESNSHELLQLVESAYAGLPRHKLSVVAPELRIKLLLTPPSKAHRRIRRARAPYAAEPPPFKMLSGSGLLGGAAGASSFVVLSPRERAALIVMSPEMLKHSYHARYELVEFAVFTLAARVQRLVSLHAACVGKNGRGILLMGPSGAGKSTIALLCLLGGFDFLSEDSVFVSPVTMLATGVANFLHVRADSLPWLGRSREAAAIRKSPVIRRRSGVKKFEVDLRQGSFRLAKSPMKIEALVFLSPRSARRGPPLRSLPKPEVQARLEIMQAYGASQPQWRTFGAKVSRLAAFELRRGRHPLESVAVLRSLLA